MTQAPPAPSLPLSQLSLRRAERGFVIGGSGAGKSSLMDWLAADWDSRYATLGGRRLILDTKPRYRAETTVRGISAARRYKDWGHGQAIPRSVVVDNPDDLALAWKNKARVVIMQSELGGADLHRLVAGAEAFLRGGKKGRPQLLQVDETLDFFHGNGSPIGGQAILRTPRAGREKDVAALYGSQRTKGMPPTIMEEMSRLYAFRIDYRADAKRLQEMGAPEFALPTRKFEFKYWFKEDYGHVHPLDGSTYKLVL